MISDCRRTADRLAPYVDNVLAPVEHAEVERHLSVCPPCRLAALAERGARTVLRDQAPALKTEPLPPGLRSRCEALAREHARTRGRWLARAGRALRHSGPRLVPVSV